MRVREYLEKVESTQFTFIKVRARKDANTPYYHQEYQTTPIFSRWEWELENSNLLDCIIVNHKQCPIDWLCGASWRNQFKKGWLESLLIISDDDFKLLYPSEEQRASMVKYIDNEINKGLEW